MPLVSRRCVLIWFGKEDLNYILDMLLCFSHASGSLTVSKGKNGSPISRLYNVHPQRYTHIFKLLFHTVDTDSMAPWHM